MKIAERRKVIRVPMVSEIVVKQVHPDSLQEGYLINVSYGGIGLYIKSPISGQAQVALDFIDRTDQRIVEKISGRVVWSKPAGLMYAHGISFDGLNPKHHKLLLSFLDRAVTAYTK
jgi:hypothetical protein